LQILIWPHLSIIRRKTGRIIQTILVSFPVSWKKHIPTPNVPIQKQSNYSPANIKSS
jgi:hypothetical protein